MLYSNFCEENFHNLLVKFFNRKYTNRCAVIRATTYPKFRLESRTLTINSLVTLKFDDHKCILIFFKFDSFLLKNGFQKIFEMGHFLEKKNSLSFETFRATNRQTIKEKIAKYDQNWKSPFLGPELKIWRNMVCEIFL